MRIGTRGSALALAQARSVADALDARSVEAQLVPITTAGDRRAAGDKSRFVKEIEDALLAGEIELAVHSAKDVPGELPEGLEIVAVPVAQDARDALVGARSLDELPEGARVGSSSLRRRSQLLAIRSDLEIAPLRGNVDTRLRKLDEGDYDAIVLAYAGLRRLGRTDEAGYLFETSELVPAPGQGALALEARAGDERTRRAVVVLDDPPSRTRLAAERALVATLDASCYTPVGAHAQARDDSISVMAYVGLPDGSEWISDRIEGGAFDPKAVGSELAQRMLSVGAAELLHRAAQALASSDR